jgi:hypothetical protein
MMKRIFLSILCGFLCVQFLSANPKNKKILRVGGMELAPYGYGSMTTHPHQPNDSTNTEFANYYAKISLWIGGITEAGDTLLTSTELHSNAKAEGFRPQKMAQDTTDVLQIGNVEFTTIAVCQDFENGWEVEQFTVGLKDYSAGLLLFVIRNSGKKGKIKNVYAGVHWDFDVPNAENHPTSDDDWLAIENSAYEISDFATNNGLRIEALFSPTRQNYWRRSQSPGNGQALYDLMKENNPGSPADTADYHFYLGSGPYNVQSGEEIPLLYSLQPLENGLSKSNLNEILPLKIAEFSRGRKLASLEEAIETAETLDVNVPASYELFQNHPNPFNPSTQITFQLPQSETVRLEIFNALGQVVKRLLDESLPAGRYRVTWNGNDQQGRPVSSGIYIYRLSTRQFQEQKKMLLIR